MWKTELTSLCHPSPLLSLFSAGNGKKIHSIRFVLEASLNRMLAAAALMRKIFNNVKPTNIHLGYGATFI